MEDGPASTVLVTASFAPRGNASTCASSCSSLLLRGAAFAPLSVVTIEEAAETRVSLCQSLR